MEYFVIIETVDIRLVPLSTKMVLKQVIRGRKSRISKNRRDGSRDIPKEESRTVTIPFQTPPLPEVNQFSPVGSKSPSGLQGDRSLKSHCFPAPETVI